MPNTLLGVDVTDTPGDSTTSDIRFQDSRGVRLGILHEDHRGYVYQYVHAAGAITQYAAVSIDEAFEATMLTKALADTAVGVGVAQVAFADNDFGWVLRKGQGSILVLANCAADVGLYSSASAGYVDDGTASQTLISGVVATASTSAAGVVPCNVVVEAFPKLPGN
jgi:hypothetical protein